MKTILKTNIIIISLFLFGWIISLFINILFDKVEILLALSKYQNDLLNWVFIIFTRFGEAIAFLGFAVIYLFIRYRVSVAIAVSGVSVLLISGILKTTFRYERPFLYFTNLGIENQYPRIDGIEPYIGLTSFPSGHTMGAFTLLVLIGLYVSSNILKVILLVTAAMVALSRMYLGHHFLEDTLFGSLLGLMIAFAVYIWVDSWKYPFLDSKLQWKKK